MAEKPKIAKKSKIAKNIYCVEKFDTNSCAPQKMTENSQNIS